MYYISRRGNRDFFKAVCCLLFLMYYITYRSTLYKSNGKATYGVVKPSA